jgi:hypothetical protein
MAKCNVCNQEMMKADSCTSNQLRYTPYLKQNSTTGWQHLDRKKQVTLDRIRCGQENGYRDVVIAEKMERCSDCNVKVGEFHHPGCDWEECPRCNRQLISCTCHEDAKVIELIPAK